MKTIEEVINYKKQEKQVWNKNYTVLKNFMKTNFYNKPRKSDCVVRNEIIYNIGEFLHTQIELYKEDELSKNKIIKLLKIDLNIFKSESKIENEIWNKNIKILKYNIKKNNYLPYPEQTEFYNGIEYHIGDFLDNQIQLYKKGILSNERKDILIDIDKNIFVSIDREVEEEDWNNNIKAIKQYISRFNKLPVLGISYELNNVDYNIGGFLFKQREILKEKNHNMFYERVNILLEIDNTITMNIFQKFLYNLFITKK